MEHKSTKEKMKDMNRKQKIEYIWYYYKFHIIGTIILIAIISSFVIDIMKSKQPVLNVTFLGQYMDADKKDELQNKITAKLVNDPKNKKEIVIDFLTKKDDPKDEYSMATLQKLQASIAAADIDILVVDKKDFEQYANQGMFMKLSKVPELSQLGIPESNYIKYQVKEVDNKEEIYGINIENIALLKDMKYDYNNKILCIVANTKRLPMATEFLKWFFSQK